MGAMQAGRRFYTPWTRAVGALAVLALSVPAAFSQQPAPAGPAAAVSLSLKDAIAIAEKHSNGGRIVEASYQGQRRSGPRYGFVAYQNDKIWDGEIDANSGQVVVWELEEAELDEDDDVEVRGAGNASVNLRQAVEIAEHSTGGAAITGGMEEEDGQILWEIVVVTEGKAHKVYVDPATGNVLGS
jgi:uncharacterized membrane protein YkoI